MEAYAKEFASYILPKGYTIFGFWMQTLADLGFLDLELQGLTDKCKIDPVLKAKQNSRVKARLFT